MSRAVGEWIGAKDDTPAPQLTDADHRELCAFLKAIQGAAILSGYPNEIYGAELNEWRRIERVAHADGARRRIECLWINPQAMAGLKSPPLPLGNVA